MEFLSEMKDALLEIEDTLDRVTSFDNNLSEKIVFNAMRYSLLGGGKRVRALLVVKTAEAFGGNKEAAYLAAAAVEMIHAYSLIHDDLPCMDNDTMRRGKPTCHIAYGEAVALLAGDALLNSAFEVISSSEMSALISAKMQIELVRILSTASGRFGMIGGQTIDINSDNNILTEKELTYLHRLKTGALIRSAVLMGAVIGGCDEKSLNSLAKYAEAIGLAFQITDDILDVVGDSALLGKNIGSDAEQEKTTYITLNGIERCQVMLDELYDEAYMNLKNEGLENSFVWELTGYLRNRNK